MATLQVRDIDNRLYDCLKNSAKRRNRSISQEVITIIESYLNSPAAAFKNSTLEFLSLTGAWKDDRTADEIISELGRGRGTSRRFGETDGLFD